MRVLVTTDTVGGIWTYALELIEGLRPHGVEVVLATMGPPASDEQRGILAGLDNVQVFEGGFRLEWMDDPWNDVDRAGEWLLDLEAQVEPDIVHLNGYAHGALPWRAPVLIVGHSCVLSWWQAVKGEDAPPRFDTYRDRVTRGLRAADAVLAPTHSMLSALDRHYGPLPRVGVIANGRDARLFPPGQKQPFIMAAGRLWDEAKNIMALEQVAPRLGWPVFVAGEEKNPGSDAAVGMHNVIPLGRLPSRALASWLGWASVYALPARYEPFGLSVLEAALAGCALVLGDIPSLREVWGDAATFVSPDDNELLARTINRLTQDGPLRSRLAVHARERALHYSSSRMASSYLECYENLIASREPDLVSATGAPS